MARFVDWFGFHLMLASSCAGCSSSEAGAPASEPAASGFSTDCGGSGELLQVGFNKTGVAGFAFELLKLTPTQPVQTSKTPGNIWSVRITDPANVAASGTLLVSASMPLHGNHPVSSPVAVDVGAGLYDIHDLLLPMPGLYTILLFFTSQDGSQDSVALLLCMSVKSG